MPWHFTYLLLGCMVCLGALVVFVVRPDLRRPIITTGLIGASVEAVAEIWYLQGYWRPPTILPWPTPEDLLYGFGVTALATCAVPFWFRRRYAPQTGSTAREGWVVLPLMVFCLVMTGLGQASTLPSIWTATLVFAVVGLVACLMRRDLWWVGLTAAAIMGVVAIIGYGVGLNYVIDGHRFLDQVLLITGTRWDIRVLGNIPLDEIAWNIARGWCVAALYPLLTAQRLVPLRTWSQK